MTTLGPRLSKLRIGVIVDAEGPLNSWDARFIRNLRADPRFDLVSVYGGARAHVARKPALELDGIPRGYTGIVDVIVNLGRNLPTSEISEVARFGVWSLEQCDRLLGRADVAAYRDSFKRRPVIAVDIIARGGMAGDRRAIARAQFNRDAYLQDQQAAACEKAVALMVHHLKRLAITGAFPEEPEAGPIVPPVSESVASFARVGFAKIGGIARGIGKRVQRTFGKQPMRWSLFVGHGSPGREALQQAAEIKPAQGEFWADPFLIERRGKTYVFYENYVYAEQRGKISVGVLDGNRLDVLGDVLKLDAHLSFPFVFEHNADVFMMPEMSERRRLDVYRAVNFPRTWTLHATAFNGRSLADPVLFEDRGQWWLFANISETPFEDHCNELHVFAVDGPALKRIVPHPLNPVVVGSDTARNGGRIVRSGDKLLRLSQRNTDGVYGRGLQVMDITRLDMEGYDERLVEQFDHTVQRGLIGLHHLDCCAGAFIFDGCRKFG